MLTAFRGIAGRLRRAVTQGRTLARLAALDDRLLAAMGVARSEIAALRY